MNFEEIALEMFDAGIVKFGEFTFVSGLKSPNYIDHSELASHPQLLNKIADAYAKKMMAAGVVKMCAVPYKAIVIGSAVCVKTNIPMLYTRKEVKLHGTKKLIEGLYTPGEEVAVIEDLVTAGTSVIETINKLKEAGLVINDVFVNIDRDQGGRENLEKLGVKLHPNMTLHQMLDVYLKHSRISKEKYEETKTYLAENKKFY